MDLTESWTVISDYLHKAKVNKDLIKSPSPRYEEREVSGVRMPHQAEQKVIQKIVLLKSKDPTF